jgi:hypothetical protein
MVSPGVSDTDRYRMMTIILKIAPDDARQLLEALMRTTEYQKTLAERIHDEGKAEGTAEHILRILDVRGIALTAEQREQVTASTDPTQLDRWFDRAITATSAAEVFAG